MVGNDHYLRASELERRLIELRLSKARVEILREGLVGRDPTRGCSDPGRGGARMSEATLPARVALVGNPNSGRTALLNALTGRRQRVANYPGVTVERKEGLAVTPAGLAVRPIDLPGAIRCAPAASTRSSPATSCWAGSKARTFPAFFSALPTRRTFAPQCASTLAG